MVKYGGGLIMKTPKTNKGNATGEGGAGTSQKNPVHFSTLDSWIYLLLTLNWIVFAFLFGDLVLHYLGWLS